MLSEVTGSKKGCDCAVDRKIEKYAVTRNGRRVRKFTTHGWKIQVEWKDGTDERIECIESNALNPIELAEYTVANKIVEEPAFAWWVFG